MNVDADVRALLAILQARVESGDDDGIYGDSRRALADIKAALARPDIRHVRRLLVPTGNVQEISIANGWGYEFLDIASKLEALLGSE
jgi:hypothetical protein